MRNLWRSFWSLAPRQLVISREGKVLIGIALAAGFAAINTGNNLLFLGWGMVLSAITVSGVLSELTLRIVHLRVGPPEQARAGEPGALPLTLLHRGRRIPAYAVGLEVTLQGPGGEVVVPGPLVLRLDPQAVLELRAPYRPEVRGLHTLRTLRAETAYPFGFFIKSRRFRPRREVAFWVAPARVDVAPLRAQLFATIGDTSARRSGAGDEFFALRPLRAGDDPRRIHWRRSAKASRPVVIETEAMAARRLRLDLDLRGVAKEAAEHALAALGSLAEDLLAADYAVGVRVPGLSLPPETGARQRWVILHGLASVDVAAPLPRASADRSVTAVALVAPGGVAPPESHSVLPLALVGRAGAA